MKFAISNKLRKKHFLYVVYSIVIILVFKYTILTNNLESSDKKASTSTNKETVVNKDETMYKDVIMPLMPDLEKKQELGRHAWLM